MSINQNPVGYLTKLLQVFINDKNAIGKQTLTISGTSQSLTPPTGATYARFQVESTNTIDAIRYYEDGSTPTSTLGWVQGNTFVMELTTSENIRNFKVIAGAGGGTTILNITYYK
jgi:hypothetical protein